MSSKTTAPKPSIKMTDKGQYMLKNVQVAWPQLHRPKSFKNDDKSPPRFSGTAFIPQDATDIIEFLQKEIAATALDKLKIKKLAPDASCLKDGNESDNEACNGFFTLGCYSYPNDNVAGKGKPTVLALDKSIITDPDDARNPESGDYCDVLFDLYVSPQYKRVNAGLKAVQKKSTGPRIGNSVDLSNFEKSEEEEEEEEEI